MSVADNEEQRDKQVELALCKVASYFHLQNDPFYNTFSLSRELLPLLS